MGPVELINLQAGEMGQRVLHKMFVEFSCRHPRRKWTCHHICLLCQKNQCTFYLLCMYLKEKWSWFDHVFFCRNSWWILSDWASGILYRRVAAKCTTTFILFLLPSWWECSPALKPRSLINGLFEQESLIMNVFFLKEEGEACWWWLNSKYSEAEGMGRNGGIRDEGGRWNEGGDGDGKRRSVGEKATQ